MSEEWDDVCSLNTAEWNENERRLFGGFITETELDPADVVVIQGEVPVGIQRVATALEEVINTDLGLDEVLEPRTHGDCIRGFRTAKELASNWGFSKNWYTADIDCLLVTNGEVYVMEMKTRAQRIEGMHDVYEGYGQVMMNRDRFVEDYPSVAEEATIKSLLVTEDSDIDITLIENSLRERKVGFFDPVRGGMLVPPR